MRSDQSRSYNGPYANDHLDQVAFPLGGIGAGMVCLEGTGALSHFSLRGQMDLFNEPQVFSALWVKGNAAGARVLEGPVPHWKIFGPAGTGNGSAGKTYGLPRFADASFQARFPFATIRLSHPRVPIAVELTGWSPFLPLEADDSSLPVAALEYTFTNQSDVALEAIYSFHARQFIATWQGTAPQPGSAVLKRDHGFTLWQPGSADKPFEQGAFSAEVDDPSVTVDCAWFRGTWFDPLTAVWQQVSRGVLREAGQVDGEPSPGGSLYVPFRLEPGEQKTIRLRLAWHVPETNLRQGKDPANGTQSDGCAVSACACSPVPQTHRPWYAAAFPNIDAVGDYWAGQYDRLRSASLRFADCFYDTTLPPEVVEAVAANLTILKSPTVQRQADGRLWCWEGCFDDSGCCHGSCTHVWNYAQAIPHLFPDLERSLRETEFGESQDANGHQMFRSNLPIRPVLHDFHAAADGQFGGILKVYREWRISGDQAWLARFWPCVKQSLAYCVETWDPDYRGALIEPHHNTYDIEFWGPDGMCTSFYLAALQAAIIMSQAVGDDPSPYVTLLARGRAFMTDRLWNGEFFYQRVEWQGLRAGDPTQVQTIASSFSPEALALMQEEGPRYQYGAGCLSDGVLGEWLAAVCGLDEVLDRDKVESHLRSVYRYNFREDLSDHANPQRPTFALGDEAGLLLCSWPHGGALTLPFPYSDEVWTGIEYQVASHLILLGLVDEGLRIVRAVRDRYDGRVRNPFDEYECGHWYARAMASYGLLQGLTGVRFDAVDKILYIQPATQGDLRVFLCTATGYGTVGVNDGQPFVQIQSGTIPFERIEYRQGK
jgi:uncharacterized protein (DUF608 family)